MSKELYELKDSNNDSINQKSSHRYQTMGMSIGMCFGVSIGMAFGACLFESGPLGMCIGLPIGMCIGIALGRHKDSLINQQLEEKGYKISEISQIDDNSFEIRIVDINGNVQSVVIGKKDMEAVKYQIGESVYLNEAGGIEKVQAE